MLDLTRLRILDAVARTGSVTAAARELRYSQPSLSHHLARLEQETGARLLQRVGRGIRLTPAGQLLADRASEILGRVDAAAAELTAHVGLSTGRVRLAGFTSVLSTLVPAAAEILRREHPGLQLTLTDTHPPEALELLRAGNVDLALIFRYDESPPEDGDIRLVHLLDDPTYLLTTGEAAPLAEYRDSTWIAGCERCRAHLVDECERAGFTPRIAYTTDDMVLMQALVAAGLGVTMIPGLALRSHQAPGVTATEIPSSTRRVYAATYGAPPDPPATAALIAALHEGQSSVAAPTYEGPLVSLGDQSRVGSSG
jgi:DNA-binding transcriptional LysR family regulator